MNWALILLLTTNAVATQQQTIYEQLRTDIETEQFKQITSVVVRQHDQLQLEEYFNGASSQTLHDIRSASKSLTSLLYGVAVSEGFFASEQDQVVEHFQDYQPFQNPFEAKTELTFDQLLSMTSPLECDDWNDYSAGHEERMYLRKDWVGFVLDLPERGHAPWQEKPEDQPYGRAFAYCTAGVSLTGAAIERATSTSLAKFTQDKLFDALNISEVKWSMSPTGITQAGGGLQIKSSDLIKLGQLMLDNGRIGDTQLVAEAWIEKMFTPYSEAMASMNADYGYLWWIFTFEVEGQEIITYAAAGNGGNYLVVVPDLSLTAVVTSTAYNTPYMHQQAQKILREYIIRAAILR